MAQQQGLAWPLVQAGRLQPWRAPVRMGARKAVPLSEAAWLAVSLLLVAGEVLAQDSVGRKQATAALMLAVRRNALTRAAISSCRRVEARSADI